MNFTTHIYILISNVLETIQNKILVKNKTADQSCVCPKWIFRNKLFDNNTFRMFFRFPTVFPNGSSFWLISPRIGCVSLTRLVSRVVFGAKLSRGYNITSCSELNYQITEMIYKRDKNKYTSV